MVYSKRTYIMIGVLALIITGAIVSLALLLGGGGKAVPGLDIPTSYRNKPVQGKLYSWISHMKHKGTATRIE